MSFDSPGTGTPKRLEGSLSSDRQQKPSATGTASTVEGAVVINQIGNKNDTPTMRDLNRYVIKKHANLWKDIGLELGLDLRLLNVIEKDHPHQSVTCLQIVLDEWLKLTTNATWSSLEVTLTNVTRVNLSLDPVDDIYAGAMDTSHTVGSNNISDVATLQESPNHAGSEMISKEEFEKFANVRAAFTALETKMTKLLRKADHLIMRRACITQTKAPGGAHLPDELVTQILMTQSIDTMLDVLAVSPYWSWIDVRLLETMVVASGSSLAILILDNYKSVTFAKRLIDVLPDLPNKEVKAQYYTEVASKLNVNPEEMTVGDLVKFQHQLEVVIMDVHKGTCVLKYLDKGCIRILWYMPTKCAIKAFHSAVVNRYQFHDLQLQYLQIGSHPIIMDPLNMRDVTTNEPSPLTVTGTVKEFIDHYYDYLSVTMDTEVVVELMLSEQLINKDTIMASSSDYQTNCLLLERMRQLSTQQFTLFCEIVTACDSETKLGDVLKKALIASDDNQSAAECLPDVDKPENVDISTGVDAASFVREFMDLKMCLEETLKHSNPCNIIERCSSLMASDQHNIPLFPTEYMAELRKETQTSDLMQQLSPFFTWSDYSILKEIIDLPKCTTLFTKFEAKFDFSQPVMSFPIAKPVSQMLPRGSSVSTVLAVRLDLQPHQLSLQDVFDIRNFILKKCEVTPHTLQLLSVAQGSSTILYLMISRCVVPLVTSKVSQNLTDLHQKGILHVAIYPSTILATGKALSVGPLSFLTCFDEMITSGERDLLSIQLSQLEELPTVVNNLLKKNAIHTLNDRGLWMLQDKDEIFEPDNLQDDQPTQQTDMSDTLMVEGMDHVENKDKSAPVSTADMLKHVHAQKSQLVVKLKKNETYKKFLEQQLDKEQQKNSTLLKQYEELKSSFGADDVQKEIHNLEGSLDEVKISFDKIKLMKTQWTEMEAKKSDSYSADTEEIMEKGSTMSLKSTESTVLLVSRLQAVNEKMMETKERSKLAMTQLRDELSETQSRLTVRDLECTKLKEENKLMIKQLSGRRTDQTRQEQMLGSGKYGEVTQVTFNTKWYASKTIHKKLLPGYPDVSADGVMEMIKQITTFLSTIKHPNVEQFVLVSQQSPTSSPTLISELLPYNLDSFIAQNKESLTVDIQLDLCHDMAQGLNYLLTAGILHTNLHGRNVLVSNEPKAVVADYICPKVLTAVDDTVTDQSYLAPEVIKSKQPPTELSTVFSLGVLCLQTVTGHPPCPSDELELSEAEQRMVDLQEVDKTHPLLPTIQQCLSDSESSRPSISEVPGQIRGNRNKLVMSNNDSPPLVEALQTKQYHLKWDKCSDLPRTMYNASVVVDDNNVYVTAGTAPEKETRGNVYFYNITTDQWNTLPPSGHRAGILCMIDGTLSIFGGQDSVTYKTLHKVSTFNRDTNSWSQTYPGMIHERFLPGVVVHGDHLMVMGGHDQSQKSLDSIETMNWQHRSPWREVSTKLPVPMCDIKPTIAGEHLLIVGYDHAGSRYPGSHQLPVSTITSSSDQVASQWEELSSAPHYFSTTVPSSNPPLIIGGEDVKGVTTSDISLYDTSKKSWIQVDNLTTARRNVGVATVNSNTIIVVGGNTKGGNVEAALSSSLPIVEIGHIVHN